MKFYYSKLLTFFVVMLLGAVSKATDFGTTGLITLPTARMQADGSLTATIARNEVVDLYVGSF